MKSVEAKPVRCVGCLVKHYIVYCLYTLCLNLSAISLSIYFLISFFFLIFTLSLLMFILSLLHMLFFYNIKSSPVFSFSLFSSFLLLVPLFSVVILHFFPFITHLSYSFFISFPFIHVFLLIFLCSFLLVTLRGKLICKDCGNAMAGKSLAS